ncbi:MAG: B12-binding domain-containing radical SAM protein [Dehalococcoidia bacterium]
MKVLLFAMPDTISALDAVMHMPNLGLCSIAGNLEGCEVKIVDLAFHNRNIANFIRHIMHEFRPEIVGLSAMSFQYDSACRVSQICRSVDPGIVTVLGGYHASLLFEEIGSSADAPLFDFIVRGEGEVTFQKLAQELVSGRRNFGAIAGLSFNKDGRFQHNPAALLLNLESLKPPDRNCRVLDGARFLGQRFDCVETSRGCTMGCKFCSIAHMYGRSIRFFALDRVVEDLKSLKQRGVEGVFFVDDNITLDVQRLKKLCDLIVSERLNSMEYVIQASVKGIASDEELAPRLKAAGFKWVFLGIESGIARNLQSMGKMGVLNNTQRAVSLLQQQGIGIFGGFIIGNPDDRHDDIRSTYRFALELGVDHPIMQCMTPYPKTEIREQLLSENLITNPDDFSRYNGFICNVRTRHMSSKELRMSIFWEGLRLYFNPRYLARSRFWQYRPVLWPSLVANNFRYLAGALKGTMFASRHSW